MKRKLLLMLSALFLMNVMALAQQFSVNGKVTDDSGNPLIGATISLKGSTTGTIADIEGNYTLTYEGDENSILVFSFIGYLTEEIPVNKQAILNMVLIQDIADIDEVVIVGYGTQKKSVVTGAIARIDKEILERSNNTRIEQSLQGQTAGVVIMNNSGQPGDNLTVRIRGVGTVKDADPLYIVDGLPLEKEGLDFLNPDDVQSIEVLKDAASTSVYGTRGANGVVLITTKSGKKNEKIQVSYSGFYGVQNPWNKVDMLNAQQYVELLNEGMANDGRKPVFDQAQIDTLVWDTDWQNEMYYKNAPKQSHTVSLTGGSENSTYSSSISYLNQDGIVAEGKSNFERIALRSNTTHDVGRIKFGTNLNFVNIQKMGIDANDQFSPYSLIQAMNTPPIIPVMFDNGEWATPEDFGLGLQEITNPVAMLSYLNRQEVQNKFIGGLSAEIEITEGLTFNTQISGELGYVTKDEYTPLYNLDATHMTTVNSVSKEIAQYNRWNFDNILKYSKTIQDHNFTAMMGLTYFKSWSENLGASRAELIFNDFDKAYIDNGTADFRKPYGGYQENRLASVFGRLNYNFREKYLLEGVIRRDGSSRFGADYRYGIFPSVSAGWVLSRENFFPAQDVLNFAKLRVSWGKNGNDQIPDFQYSPVMTNEDIYFFGSNQDMYNGIRPQSIPNSEVRWETSQQFNLGTNLGFVDNHITLTVDYYDKRTVDWLLTPPSRLILGNEVSDENMGEVANKGIEIELGYKNKINKFSYSASFIAASNKSKVVSIENTNGYFTGGSSFAQGGDILRVEPGQPLGYFWGHRIKGVFQNVAEINSYLDSEGNLIYNRAVPGDFIFEDLNGDGKINDDDKTNIGSPYPKFTGGLNLSCEWKGIDVYMFWYTALGHDIYLGLRRYDVGAVNYSQEDYDNRWTGEGSTNEYPRFTLIDRNENYAKPSEYFVRDADYLRLKNLTIGYTLPSTITKSVNISKVRFYVMAENLLTFTKYTGLEPEIGGEPLNLGIDQGVYPQSLTFIGGLNITF